MKTNIQHEIDKTLDCLGEQGNVEVSPAFVDAFSNKIGHLHARRNLGYRSRAFYPVIVLLMVMLNAAALMGYFGKQGSASEQSYDEVAVVASEYGVGQSSYTTF